MKEKKKVKNKEIIIPVEGSFPIVGIGASAGGLAAFESFFSGMANNVNPQMAFVIVQHLDPDHKSILTSLIQRFTKMEVYEVEDSMVVKVNCVYIIPPARDISISQGKLQLSEPKTARGHRLPIDYFFQSLANEAHELAIGIVLSGTGNDGTLGLQAIKSVGGLTIAQKPESADYDGMPRSAINAGLIDYELSPSEMFPELINYTLFTNKESRKTHQTERITESSLQKIFLLLIAQTGHDFSGYKSGTINRRIERRMAIKQMENLEAYVVYLKENSLEVDLLFRDLLISVTSFFRDPEAFKILESEIIPQLFKNKPPGSMIRVWIPGCATGEEAYSIAILLQEYLDSIKQNYKLQIFATDIDSRAIAFARTGLYPAGIAVDVSPERLVRFFVGEQNNAGYRISKRIRDILVFSEQDVIKDPPFSKLDLISCRNLLIYLDLSLQKKLISLFHYALQPEGMLLLGTSETIGEFTDLFSSIDRKWKIFMRKENFRNLYRSGFGKYFPSPRISTGKEIAHTINLPTQQKKVPFREVAERVLLAQVTPPSILVDREGNILYRHGRTGMFLEPPIGESGINNIFKMAREGLRHELSIAFNIVLVKKETVSTFGISVKTNGHFTKVDFTIRFIASDKLNNLEELYLISLEESSEEKNLPITKTQEKEIQGELDTNVEIAILKRELQAKEDYLHATNEELEASNEELKSSNEEMQSVNEELQSTNEELETSKEEMQSSNEELITVNSELASKLNDLSRVNNDMNNLISGTGIATIFVDFSLRILRFTPSATQIINLIPADAGRPIGHILSNIVNYSTLLEDIQTVLDTLIPKETEVQTKDNRWYVLRILPYRTIDNIIEGAVITFVEITETKRIEAALEQERINLQFQSTLLQFIGDSVIATDLNGTIIYWNSAAEKTYGWKSEEVIGKSIMDITPTDASMDQGREIMNALQAGETWKGEFTVKHRDGHSFTAWVTDTAIKDESGNVSAIIGISRDITEKKNDEAKIKALLTEKEIMLTEVHHRIKNNMTSIHSLLEIQASSSKHTEAKKAIRDASDRILSMLHLYDILYTHATFDLVSIKEYIPSLVDMIVRNLATNTSVRVEKNIEDFILDTKTLQTLGIIINELIANIMKYAFLGRSHGLIKVSATRLNDKICIVVADNGVGIPETTDSKNSSGFGLQLVEGLTKQLKGSVKIEQENGTRITIEIKK